MMALILRETEKYGVNADDEDFAVGFLAALRNAGEFTYKSGYKDFFNNCKFGQLRVAQNHKGNTVFCLVDVCKALGIGNASDVKKRLDSGNIDLIEVTTKGKNQHGEFTRTVSMTYIGEANLYRSIFQSKKKEAKEFQDWVFNTVLPQIQMAQGERLHLQTDSRADAEMGGAGNNDRESVLGDDRPGMELFQTLKRSLPQLKGHVLPKGVKDFGQWYATVGADLPHTSTSLF
ncbi:MAG: Bro-N domain-containing protein [Prevotella sp.]